jgi:CheY-like chemotaxis protein
MTSKHTILYAEDDLDDLFFVKEAFEKHDHIKVVHAINGLEALNILESLQEIDSLPCLIILDINMPLMDGKETLERIKSQKEFTNVPVVLFSTSSSLNDRQFAQAKGAELITKPLKFDDLEGIAKAFVEKCNFESKVKMA